jgi:hypothetical protein
MKYRVLIHRDYSVEPWNEGVVKIRLVSDKFNINLEHLIYDNCDRIFSFTDYCYCVDELYIIDLLHKYIKNEISKNYGKRYKVSKNTLYYILKDNEVFGNKWDKEKSTFINDLVTYNIDINTYSIKSAFKWFIDFIKFI